MADTRSLRDAANKAAAAGKFKKAIECFAELEREEPRDASWPKRMAEMYRRMGKDEEAVAAYERAVARYAEAGFLAQGIAVCKIILQIDPTHSRAASALADMAEKQQRHGAVRVATSTVASGAAEAPALDLGIDDPPVAPVIKTPPRVVAPVPRSMLDFDAEPEVAIDIDIEEPEEPLELLDDEVELVDEATGTISLSPLSSAPKSLSPLSLEPMSLSPLDEFEDDNGLDEVPTRNTLVDALSFEDPLAAPSSPSFPQSFAQASPPPSASPLLSFDDDLLGPPTTPMSLPDELLPDPKSSPGHGGPQDLASQVVRRIPVMSGLSGQEVHRLLHDMEPLQVQAGDLVDTSRQQRLYLIVHGTLEVTDGPLGRERRTAGDYVGESSALMGADEATTILAITDCEILAIARESLIAVLSSNGDFAQQVVDETRSRRTQRLLEHHELFVPFNSEDRHALLDRFTFRQLAPGEMVVEAGRRAAGLYVLLTGSVRVLLDDVIVMSLGPGEIVGEGGILPGEVSPSTVMATSRCWALVMPEADFKVIMMTHPHVLAVVGDIAEKRWNRLTGKSVGDFESLDLL